MLAAFEDGGEVVLPIVEYGRINIRPIRPLQSTEGLI